MKKIFVYVLSALTACCQAADIPALRDLNALQVQLLPDSVGKPVEFTFEKQDLNGYAGTDAIVCTLMAPSGKNIWEAAVPDDGDTTGNWKTGKRQPVKVSFTPGEPGIYIMKFNTSSPDIQLQFDRATVKNAAWGFSAWSMRFSGAQRLAGYLLIPPVKLGEMQTQVMQFCTTRHSKVTNVSISTADGKKLISNHTLPFTKKMTYHELKLQRLAEHNIYCIEAENFVNVVRFVFPQYGNIGFFTDLASAQKFEKYIALEGNFLKLSAGKQHPAMALGGNRTFQITFVPQKAEDKFDFTINIADRKLHFSNNQPDCFFTTGSGNYYTADLTAAAPGSFELIPAAPTANALLPESGSTAAAGAELVWSPVPGVKEYTLQLKNAVSGKVRQVRVAGNRYPASKIAAGVWQWQVFGGGKGGKAAYLTIPQKDSTMLAYCYDFTPAMDTTLTKAPEELACRVGLLKTDDIDFARTYATVNGKKYPVRRLSGTRIEAAGDFAFQAGRNQIGMTIYSKSGIRSSAYWGFFLGRQPDQFAFTHDRQGNIYCFDTPFYPVIYYGYMAGKLAIERHGFNTVLGNTLPNKGLLDQLLRRNLKLLDSGSVYYGIYSKPANAAGAEADVKRAAADRRFIHPARLGAWMDEMDVHREVSYIQKFLALFGSPANGWRGVCACNNQLYGKMAELGDFLMIDHYGFGKTIFSTDSATAAGKRAAGGKPLMSLVKGYSGSDPKLTGFIPGPRDIEYAAFSTLRNRANALGLYQCGEYRLECSPDTWRQASEVYQKVSAVTFALYGEDAEKFLSVKAASGKPGFRAVKYGNALYIIAQNASFEPGAFEFALKNVNAKDVKVLFENRSLDLTDGRFTDAFTSEATHIYYIEWK